MNDKRKKILSIIGALFGLAVLYFGYKHWRYVSTDNAQIGAHVTMLSSRVNGTIVKVLVDENQKVKAGTVLAQVDTSDFSNASDAAQAEVASLQARYREAETNYKRAVDLYREQAISKERFDNALAAYKELSARMKAAEAQSNQANLNVSYTRIVAPTDGTIARKSVEVGQFVPAGQPLFGFVEGHERWIVANLKETELDSVHIGQKVAVDVDAVSKSFDGEVESIGPGTGAVFSLLPADNATGNFTKVVQRVPVRIKLTNLSPEDIDHLQAGLSAEVEIKVH